MHNQQADPPEEVGFSISGQNDTFTAGDAVLDRAKSVAQRIADRVRELTQETKTSQPVDSTEVHRPLLE